MVRAAVKYTQLSAWPLWPIRQNADYAGFPLSKSWQDPAVLANAILLIGLLVTASWLLRRNKMALWGIWFFAVSMAPVANVIPMMQVLAERFLYLPLVGATVFLGALLDHMNRKRAALIAAVSIGYMLILCFALERRLPVWRNDVSLQRDAYEADPTNWRAAYTYGMTLVNAGETTRAASIARSNRLERDNPWFYVLLMRVSVSEGQTTEAIKALDEATRLQPKGVAKYWVDLAARLVQSGDLANAEKCLSRAIDLEPNAPGLRQNLTDIRAKTNAH
jgi:tetratricopeptide (TPR) repeat protein